MAACSLPAMQMRPLAPSKAGYCCVNFHTSSDHCNMPIALHDAIKPRKETLCDLLPFSFFITQHCTAASGPHLILSAVHLLDGCQVCMPKLAHCSDIHRHKKQWHDLYLGIQDVRLNARDSLLERLQL